MTVPQCEFLIHSLHFQYVIFWSPGILSHPSFQSFGKIDNDKYLSDSQHILSYSPRSHPPHPALLSTPANLQFRRYMLSDGQDGLETATLQYARAVFLPLSIPPTSRSNFISAFFLLMETLFYRSRKHDQPSDVKFCIKYLHHLSSPFADALRYRPQGS